MSVRRMEGRPDCAVQGDAAKAVSGESDAASGHRAGAPTAKTKLDATARKRFLETLAATCCVQDAVRAAGVDPKRFYALRQRDAGFRAEWQLALAAGYDAIEAKLLRFVLTGGRDGPAEEGVAGQAEIGAGRGAGDGEGRGEGAGEKAGKDDAAERTDGAASLTKRFRHGVGKVTDGIPTWVHVAMMMLNKHRATVDGTGKPQMLNRKASVEGANALLRKRLEQLARANGRAR